MEVIVLLFVAVFFLLGDPAVADLFTLCRFDASRVESAEWMETCANIVAQGLQSQSAAVVRVMGLAACIGNQTDAATLAIVAAEPEDCVQATLERCVLLGYMAHGASSAGMYRFMHDKIADAAYSSIESGERQAVQPPPPP